MAELDNLTKRKLESIFGMSGGYVLDFTNATFGDFIRTAIGIEPYDKYGTELSKARLLRAIWEGEPDYLVAKLNLELLEHQRVTAMLSGREPSAIEAALYDELKAQFAPLIEPSNPANTAFLAKDFGQIDLAELPRALSSQSIVEARLHEIDTCLEAGAPLAVIFLVGSTLEGVLLELGKANATEFVAAPGAPVDRTSGRTRPIDQWRLVDLIAVSHNLRILSDDVFKFADHVRNFRNYIHPRQQLAEGFEPRMETARIAQQVLRAALADLERSSASDATELATATQEPIA